MMRLLKFSLFLMVLLWPALSNGHSITGPDVRIAGNDIYVAVTIIPDDKFIEEVNRGVDKEIRIYIDLFKIWKIWPDEFVLGKSFVRTIKADTIKKEFIATSLHGNTLTEKRFRSLGSMLSWVFTIKDMKLTSTKELEQGKYFIKVTVESRIRKLPPVIGYLLVFLPENEFRMVKDSTEFLIEAEKK